jgi:hypothetical protein
MLPADSAYVVSTYQADPDDQPSPSSSASSAAEHEAWRLPLWLQAGANTAGCTAAGVVCADRPAPAITPVAKAATSNSSITATAQAASSAPALSAATQVTTTQVRHHGLIRQGLQQRLLAALCKW